MTITRFLLTFLLGAMLLPAQQNRLLILSIDGLDHRWLRDRDSLGLRIPHLRKLMDEGMLADGVTGIVPTVTWPSHTTIITGLTAPEHGIISNNQPGEPGQRWWYVRFLKAKTLWHLAHEKGLKTAAVWWPVTVGADSDGPPHGRRLQAFLMRQMPKRLRLQEANIPPTLARFARLVIRNNAVLGRRQSCNDRCVRRPRYGRDDTGHAIGQHALIHELSQMRDPQAQAVAIAQPAVVQAVDGED